MTSAISDAGAGKEPARKAPKWSRLKLYTVAGVAGIVLAVAGYIRKNRNISTFEARAKVQIELLSTAIEKYKLDNGEYPGLDEDSPVDGDISDELYMALFYEGWDSKTNDDGSIPIYLNELDPRSDKQSLVEKTKGRAPLQKLKILDPWGRPYLYRKGTLASNPDYDLWSKGKDGKTDASNSSKTAPGNRDDIRNF